MTPHKGTTAPGGPHTQEHTIRTRNAPADTRTQPFNGWLIGWFPGWLAAYYYYNVTPDQPAFAIGMMVGLTIAVGLTLRNPGWLFGWVFAWYAVSVLASGGPADVSRYDHADTHSTPAEAPFVIVHEYDLEPLPKFNYKPLPMSDEELFKFPRLTPTADPAAR